MGFKIGSINMYKFSNRKDNEIAKELGKIADAISKEDFDIVALQEVFNERAAEELTSHLGSNWAYVWAAPDSRSRQAAEGYAYIWQINRFRLATAMKREERGQERVTSTAQRRFNPRIHQNYKAVEGLHDGRLIRDPFYARFESVRGWYEIRLINTHLIFHELEKEDGDGDKKIRKRELQILSRIYDQIEDKVYRNTRKAYTFLLGDYNLSLEDIGQVLGNEAITAIITDRDHSQKTILTSQEKLTTLKKRSRSEPDQPVSGYANNYDHFSYSEDLKRSLSMEIERVDSVKKYWGNDFELHLKEFSDHVPIKLVVEFK